jgi:arsenate reductase
MPFVGDTPVQKLVVLFLCTGNSARSQMAEALLRKHAGDRFEALSAGLNPVGINPLTVKVMEEIGVDLSGHMSKDLASLLGRAQVHYVVYVCDRAENNCPTAWPGVVKHLSWPFEDPAAAQGDEEARLAKFRRVRDQINERILSWLNDAGPPAPPAATGPAKQVPEAQPQATA